MTLSSELVERTIREWDDHFSTCSVCLTEGERLCFEGEYLTERVVVSRAALHANLAAEGRLLPVGTIRSQTLPGVPA